MKRWTRRIAISLALTALTLGILYECATHVGRGWLRGEAFYEGRPTSYWCARIDHWESGVVQFMKKEARMGMMKPPPLPPPTLLEHISSWHSRFFGLDKEPKVLCCEADAEPVLRELAADPKYADVVRDARRRCKIRRMYDETMDSLVKARDK